MLTTFRTDTALGYSQAVRAGHLLFVSGQVAVDERGQVVGGGDIRAHVDQVFKNLRAVVEAGGSRLDLVAHVLYDEPGLSARNPRGAPSDVRRGGGLSGEHARGDIRVGAPGVLGRDRGDGGDNRRYSTRGAISLSRAPSGVRSTRQARAFGREDTAPVKAVPA